MLAKLKLSTRILLLGISIIILFVAVIALIFPKFKQKLYDQKYEQTQNLLDSAYSVMEKAAAEVQDGSMSEAEAKAYAAKAISQMRYDNGNYFFIVDLDAVVIMHGAKPELKGKDMSGATDPSGIRFIYELTQICKKEGGGFLAYQWEKAGESFPSPKISYGKLLEDWGWIVGTGIYVDDVEKEVWSVLSVVIMAALLIIALSLILAVFMSRSITTPILSSVQTMKESAGQVRSASRQVAESGQQMAQGSSDQASALEEASSSLEEMSSMTTQNADHSKQADSLMQEVNHVVKDANRSMSDLITAMAEISQASQETSKIIKTIDEIAFQTNLLALNAAVEAARAGEAGAGFAVVADEVRNLAMRAADAAKDTSGLIEATVKKINDGSVLVTGTNDSFGKVSESAAKVGDLIAEISAASQEQSSGINQINLAVSEMNTVVQENAASAQESASASEEMNAQAEEMQACVFNLEVMVTGQNTGTGKLPDTRPPREQKQNPAATLPAAASAGSGAGDAETFTDF